MSIGWRVTASDIKVWTESKKRNAEELLPLLIKKLIIASSRPEEIHFPSGDSIAVGGLDGELVVGEGNAFIPKGKSVWEFGTNQQVKGKADGDYLKRTNDPGDINTSETTFVFVTSRIWSKKKDWIKEKKKDQVWKDVKGINADDIESWLELCPAVHRWFANILGKRVELTWDICQAWESWAHCTYPPLNEQIVLNGRTEQKDYLINQLGSTSNLVRVKCQSEDEAYAFILATLKDNAILSPKTLIIKEQKAWDTIVDSKNALILIPYKFTPENIGYTRKRGHNVILPEPETVSLQSSDLKLERMSRSDRIKALNSLCLSEKQAEKIYKETRGYLEIIKRHALLTPQDRIMPGWINKYDTNILFSIFFVTEWNRKFQKDISTLSRVSNLPYEELEQKLSELKNEEEPPIRLVGDVWQLISKIDFWSLISHKVERRYIESLKEIVVEVLGESDLSKSTTKQDFPIKNFNLMSEKHSYNIKTGIADTLALLASLNGNYDGALHYGFNELINTYVKTLFETYSSSERWHNLREHFVQLAEASPDIFLTQLEQDLQLTPTPIALMFEDQKVWRCTHASLLWSLELISWDLSYFTRVVKILARLCQIDPGGRYSNRPINTLKEMFIGWTVNCNVSLEQRIQIIDNVLIKQYPKISWELLISLLPDNSTVSSSIHKPKYRDWAQNSEKSVFSDEYAVYIDKVSMNIVGIAQLFPALYYKELIENIEKLSLKACEYVIDCLTLINQTSSDDKVNTLIYNELRKKVAKHKEFYDCDWALPIDMINKLEELYKNFEPNSIMAKVKYLFDNHYPELIMPLSYDRTDYKLKQKCIEQERIYSLELLYKNNGINGIEELIKHSEESYTVGQAIANSSLFSLMQDKFISWLDSPVENLLMSAKSFILTMSNINKEWVVQTVQNFSDYNKDIQLNFLLSLQFSSQIYDLIEQQDDNLKSDYWITVPWSKLHVETTNVNLIIEKLLTFKRFLASLKLFSNISYAIEKNLRIDSKLLATALLNIESDPEYKSSKNKEYSHDIYLAINYIQKEESLDDQVIIQIEWFYLPLFRYDSFNPIFLQRNIMENPELFAQILSWCTKSQNEIDKGNFWEPDSRREAAVSLLDSLTMIPGQDSKGNIDVNILKDWVIRARNSSKELDREKIGDCQIGELLVNAPVGSDNIWPHEAVRNVIEDSQSTYIERALEIGVINGRGVTVRSAYEGGKQEKELAKKYLQDSQQLSLLWPRTSRILRNLSESYNKDAWREDIEVELRD